MLVPFGADGGTDVPARFFAAKLAKILGQNIVVSNVEGVGSTVGATQLSQAAADCYNFGFLPSVRRPLSRISNISVTTQTTGRRSAWSAKVHSISSFEVTARSHPWMTISLLRSGQESSSPDPDQWPISPN